MTKNRVVHFLMVGVIAVLVWFICSPQKNRQHSPTASVSPELQRLVRSSCQSLDMNLEHLAQSVAVDDAQNKLVAQAPLIMLCTKGTVKFGLEDVSAYSSAEELQQRIRDVRARIVRW
jgi:hypothetical protein